jgi:hypothetical protein
MALVGGTINAVSAAVEVNGLGVQMNGLSVEEPSGLADGMQQIADEPLQVAADRQQIASETPQQPIPTKLFEIKAIKGKGLGMFARDPIPRGTTILEEEPLMRLQGQDYTPEEIEAAFQQLTPENKEKFLSLHSIHGLKDGGMNPLHLLRYSSKRRVSAMGRLQARSGKEPSSVSIFFANSMSAGDNAAVILFDGSRINHSCIPNASYVWCEELGVERIRSVKDIEAGEVDFRSYIFSTD